MTPEEPLPEYENEIYRYAVKTERGGTQKCYILELTESGQAQTELILPEKIDGIRLAGFGYSRYEPGCGGNDDIYFKSENLIKLYVPYDIDNALWDYRFDDCENCRPVVWKDLNFEAFTYKGRIIGYNLLSEYLESIIASQIEPRGILANVSYMYNYDRIAFGYFR